MAVTKIWAIHNSVSRVVDYCTNPSKTKLSDLEQVLLYAADKEKTWTRGSSNTPSPELTAGRSLPQGRWLPCRGASAKPAAMWPTTLTSPSRPVRLRRGNAIASAWRRCGGFGGTTGRCLLPLTSTPALITTTLL